MNNTPNDSVHAEPSLRYAQPGDIVKDLARLGPAPNASREALVTVVSLAIAAVVLAVLKPEPVATGVVSVAIVVYLAGRWAIGARKWGRR